MGNKRIKRIVLLSIAALFCLFIWRLNSPYKLTQFPYFCGLLYSIDKINIPESYLNNDIENYRSRGYKIIECSSAFYDKKSKEVKLRIKIRGNMIDIFSLVVQNVSLYMKNHPDSYLNECKIDIVLDACGGSAIIIQNYDEDKSDFISEPRYKFSYCSVAFFVNPKLSEFKNYTWLECINFEEVVIDNINSLDNLSDLKEIRCPQDMFSDEQKQKLIDKHKGLVFTSSD